MKYTTVSSTTTQTSYVSVKRCISDVTCTRSINLFTLPAFKLFLQKFKVLHIAHNDKSGRRGREVEVVTQQVVE